MVSQVSEVLSILLNARNSVRGEMARLATVQPLDRNALSHLGRKVQGYAEQADALILMMVQQKAPDTLVAAVEEIFDAFRDAGGQIETVMRRGRL